MIHMLKDLDLVYLSYDEENEDNWYRIKSIKPTAKRIHSVKGFDRAHKLCAEIAETDRLIIVDGDNWLHDNFVDDFYNLSIDDTGNETACFSFSSINAINGLTYGNGGVKVWNRTSLLQSSTHENSDSVDFCWSIPYYQDNRVLSITVQNNLEKLAWRSGYREVVKMTLDEGRPRQMLSSTWYMIHDKNFSRLNIWMSVGRDSRNGIWAILGARQAFYELMTEQLVHSNINSYDWFEHKWEEINLQSYGFGPEIKAMEYAKLLSDKFNFYIPELDRYQSSWFKKVYINPVRKGLMK